MIRLTYLPPFVRAAFRGLPGMWKGRHQLVLCWLILMQVVFPGPKKLKQMARWTPAHITEWRFRRLLKAAYWSVELVLNWWVQQVLLVLPAPEDGRLCLLVDGSEKPKRGQQHPVAQKGRKSNYHAFFFGIRFVVLMAAWDVYRVPVAFRLILPKRHRDYRKENALFGDMVAAFVPPAWARQVVVVGDSAYASRDNMRMMQRRDQADADRDWRFVFGIARTWKTVEGKSLKDLVNHLPRRYYRRTWVPRVAGQRRRKTVWVFGKQMCLAHVGDVMVVLSKLGPNQSPKKAKLIVTNLTTCTPRQIVAIYQCRWAVEILLKELKSGLGLGEHQVTKSEDRVEKSVAIAFLGYLFLIHARHQDIQPGKPWSIFQLQNAFRLQVVTNQVEHSTELKIRRLQKAA